MRKEVDNVWKTENTKSASYIDDSLQVLQIGLCCVKNYNCMQNEN